MWIRSWLLSRSSTGWVHLRKSNTEPIIRVYSEAATMDEANALAQKVIDVVHSTINRKS